jgi:hypothetical protein
MYLVANRPREKYLPQELRQHRPLHLRPTDKMDPFGPSRAAEHIKINQKKQNIKQIHKSSIQQTYVLRIVYHNDDVSVSLALLVTMAILLLPSIHE